MRNRKLTRRGFLGKAAGAGLGALAALPALPANGLAENTRTEDWKSTSDQPPRKVIVGTVMQPFYGKYPGLENRLRQLTQLVDQLQAQSQKQ